MKQKGPSQKQQKGGAAGQRVGATQHQRGGPQSVDRSMVGRKYDTGAAMRSAQDAAGGVEQATQPSEMQRVAGSLHEQHGDRIAAGSQRAGVSSAATAAVVLTETSQLRGVSDDRMAVRFEPYEFFSRTGNWLVATHRDQQAEHDVFAQARGIDGEAAHESLRMGVAQLSGQEFAAAGYESAEQMYTKLQSGHDAQIDGLVDVICSDASLQSAMSAQDWHAVAELRAGPGFGALGYDDALAAYADAYKRASFGVGGGDDDDEKPAKPKKPAKKRKKP